MHNLLIENHALFRQVSSLTPPTATATALLLVFEIHHKLTLQKRPEYIYRADIEGDSDAMAAPPRRQSTLSMSTTVTEKSSTQYADGQQQQQQHSIRQSQLIQTSTTGGLRVPSNRKTIYDRHLNRSQKADLSRASFAFLFAEMVTYAQRRVTGIQDLEKRYIPLTTASIIKFDG